MNPVAVVLHIILVVSEALGLFYHLNPFSNSEWQRAALTHTLRRRHSSPYA